MSGPDEGFDDVEPLSAEEEQAVSALLASLPAEPMPTEVFARIEAALAAEPALVGVAPVMSLDSARSRKASRGPLIFKVAASVVGLVGAIALGLAVVSSGGSSSGGSAASMDSGAGKSAETAASSAPAASSAAAGSTAASGAASRSVRLSATGKTYDTANLAARAAALVGARTEDGSAATASPSASTPVSAVVPGAGTGAGTTFSADQVAHSANLLDACVNEITDGNPRTPIAVDVGSWNGEPALVIVLPAQNDPSSLEVFAVRPTCGQVKDSSDILQFTSIARP